MSFDKQNTNVVSIAKSREASRSPDREEAGENVCPICFGTGTRLEEGKGAAICECRRTNSGSRALVAARIPPLFLKCSLEEYHPKNPSQYAAFNFAQHFVQDYPAVDIGLMFMGPVGVGKTHLAIAILIELIKKKGVNCLFYESGSLLKAIQESYNPISKTSEMRVLAPVVDAEVLLLDELGATPPTEWVNHTIYQLINKRYNDQKLTILTTNFLDEVPAPERPRDDQPYEGSSTLRKGFKIGRKAPTSSEYTLEERLGTPLRSRLYQMCKKVVIEGEDFRIRKGQRRAD
jgi:DNA replication protein DnaC